MTPDELSKKKQTRNLVGRKKLFTLRKNVDYSNRIVRSKAWEKVASTLKMIGMLADF